MASAFAAFAASLKGLKKGDFVDARDAIPSWRICEVDAAEESKIRVHYCCWPSRYDEWIEISSGRLAPFRTYTIGHTGPKQKGVSKFILEKPEELKTFDVLEAKMKSLVKTDGPPFSPASDVIEVSQYVNNVVIDAVFESKSLLSRLDQFLQGIVILSLKYLKKNHDMPDALAQALWRTFDGDLKDRRFFVTYGVFFDEPITEGRFARRNVHPVQEVVQYDDSG
eukprot:TRINITY_DN872_c0_g1_i14.p1 TRINITY_DN872_c0_g1~~TRINITY_DN872_c0_g1_i14.p1  ORF type:complete len:224 (+),score=65.45 TRINITY_DN872_c0_g1_i14:236-907(+)